jgi:predicted amidophosphoribosyltransferase
MGKCLECNAVVEPINGCCPKCGRDSVEPNKSMEEVVADILNGKFESERELPGSVEDWV